MTQTSPISDAQKQFSLSKKIEPKANTNFKKYQLLIKACNTAQMTFAELYLNGLELPDNLLQNTFNSIIPFCYRYFSALLIPEEKILTESVALAEHSQELMELQYNLPTEMFCQMLGEDNLLYPKYTMALWSQGSKNLREAQIAMLEDVIAKAQIQDGDNILDIGCGWGSAAHYILDKFPQAQVTGLNLSQEQCKYLRGKMQDANSHFSSNRFTLVEGDFNEINFTNKFDKIISLGVFEHIGNISQSLAKISSFLQEQGKVFLHIFAIQLPHNIWNPFIDKYIFPGGRVWHYDMISNCSSCCDRLNTVDRWFINGSNYAQTLQAWLNNFDAHQDIIKNFDYGMSYPQFRRMWRLYLQWCIAYFKACNGEVLGNAQYLMVRS
jgi:cyclopropane-fatty-acyl-phospholipid synthase